MRKFLKLEVFLIPVFLAACWYGPLTVSPQALEYFNDDGTLREPEKAIAVRAPAYMEALKAIQKREGRKIPALVPGTILSIEVFGAEGLSRTVTLRSDGNIDFPLVGQVEASGQTVEQFRNTLTAALDRYYHNPQVIVNVQSTELGEGVRGGYVNVVAAAPSAFVTIRGSGLSGGGGGGHVRLTGDETLMDIVAGSGLVSGQLDWQQVVTIRPGGDSVNLIIISDIRNIVQNGDLSEDIPMQDGDIVFVPVDRNTWIEELIANLRVIRTVTGDVDFLVDVLERRTE